MPGHLAKLDAKPSPPIITVMPTRATASASALTIEIRSPRIGHARKAAHTGSEVDITAASLPLSQTSASPMNAVHAAMVNSDTSNKRSHMARGTPRDCFRYSAKAASAKAPATPARPREDRGGHSVNRFFMMGKLIPQPIDAATRKATPVVAMRALAPACSDFDMTGQSKEARTTPAKRSEVHAFCTSILTALRVT